MRCLGPYDDKAVPSFAILVTDSTPDRRAALKPLQRAVATACAAYDDAAPEVHDLQPITLTAELRNALIDGYDGRTVAIKRRLAKMIDSLPAADADLCPYCSLDTNPDLDHFLPKARFPEFSLHARNLIPICTTCNRKKLNAFKKGNGDRLFLHPSTEPSNNALVLKADLTFKNDGMSVRYRIDDAGLLSKTERALVDRHYLRLGLGARYSRRAHSHLASFKLSIGGAPMKAVSQTLDNKISTASIGEPVNGWRPALYRTIADNKPQTLAWLSKA